MSAIRNAADKIWAHRRLRQLGMLLAVISFLIFLSGVRDFHLEPGTTEIYIDGRNSTSYVSEPGRAFVSITQNNLLFADGDNTLIRILDVSAEDAGGLDCFPYFLKITDDTVYVLGSFSDDESAYFSGLKLVKYSLDGKYLGDIYVRNYNTRTFDNFGYLDSITVKNGCAYVLEIVNQEIKLLELPLDKKTVDGEAGVVCTVQAPEKCLHGEYNAETGMIILQSIFGDVYEYSVVTGELKRLENHPFMFRPDFSRAPVIKVSGLSVVMNIVYYLSIVYLVAVLFVGFVRLLLSKVFSNNHLPFFLVFFLFLSIGFLSYRSLYYFAGHHKENVSRLADVVSDSVSRTAPDFFDAHGFLKTPADISNPEASAKFRKEAKRLSGFIRSQAFLHGRDIALDISVFLFDDKGEAYLVAESYEEIVTGSPLSDKFQISADEVKEHIRKGDVFVYEDIDGRYFAKQCGLYDKSGQLTGFLSLNSENTPLVEKQRQAIINAVFELLALLVFIYVVYDGSKKYYHNFCEFRAAGDKSSVEARSALTAPFVFLVQGVLYMDVYFLVMVVAAICKELNSTEMAFLMALPLTAQRVGCSAGSFLTSWFVGFFNERRAAVISILCTFTAFLAMAYACYDKNIYILTAAKFIEGFFLESMLYAISEGIPFALKDEAVMTMRITELKSAALAAMVFFIMATGMIAENFDYSMVYITAAVLTLLLLPFARYALSSETGKEEIGDSVGNSWKMFTKPTVIFYLITFVIPVAIMGGYESYFFQLIAEGAGFSEMMLASIGVLCNTFGYFSGGIWNYVSRTPLVRPSILAFTGIGAGLLLFIANSSVYWAIVVLFAVTGLNRLNDYYLVPVTQRAAEYGCTEKQAQENFYAVEDMLSTLQAPVYGALISVGTVFCAATIGAGFIILPRLYSLSLSKKEKLREVCG